MWAELRLIKTRLTLFSRHYWNAPLLSTSSKIVLKSDHMALIECGAEHTHLCKRVVRNNDFNRPRYLNDTKIIIYPKLIFFRIAKQKYSTLFLLWLIRPWQSVTSEGHKNLIYDNTYCDVSLPMCYSSCKRVGEIHSKKYMAQ